MKAFRRQALAYVSNQITETERKKKVEAAEAAEAKRQAQAAVPLPNRKTRRAQARFNTLLNRKLGKANSLGQGVSMSIAPDGGVIVKASKSKLVGEPVANTDTTSAVRGEELERRLEELDK